MVSNNKTVFIALTFLLLLGWNHSNAQTCSTCSASNPTWTVSTNNNTNYTINTGQTLYITATGTVTGTISLSGGTIVNQGTFSPSSFNMMNTASIFNNCGKVSVNNYFSVFSGTFNNCTVGTITVSTSYQFSVSGFLNNYGAIVAKGGFLNQGTITNKGKINVTGNLTNQGNFYNDCSISIIGDFTNQGTFTGPTASNSWGAISCTGHSTNQGTFGISGHLDFCDAGHPANGWDFSFGGTGSTTYCVHIGTGCTQSQPVVNISPSAPSICSGQCSNLTAAVTGGFAPYTYSWSGSLGTNSAVNACPNSTSTYTLTVTDNTGQTSNGLVTVTVGSNPVAHAGNDVTINSGNATTLGGSPAATGGTPSYTYSWTPATAINNTTLANPSASPISNMTYILTVTDSKNCRGTDNINVTVITVSPSSSVSCISLTRSLDGGFYPVGSTRLLAFHYYEEYNDVDNLLTYKVYTKPSMVLISNSNTALPVHYGDNRYQLDVSSLNIGYYTLEVANEKNEKWFLRFKVE